jgi:SNF2 family DNA or RNA helicase
MPKKYDHIVFCPLTPKQIDVYKAFLAVGELYNILHKDDDCDCDSGKRSGFSPELDHLLTFLPSSGERGAVIKNSRALALS